MPVDGRVGAGQELNSALITGLYDVAFHMNRSAPVPSSKPG